MVMASFALVAVDMHYLLVLHEVHSHLEWFFAILAKVFIKGLVRGYAGIMNPPRLANIEIPKLDVMVHNTLQD